MFLAPPTPTQMKMQNMTCDKTNTKKEHTKHDM